MHLDSLYALICSFLEKLSNPVPFFTAVIAFLTGLMVWMAYRQEVSLKRIERAYLFADVSAHGNILSTYDSVQKKMTITFWNNGKTPAELLQVRAYGLIQRDVPDELVDDPQNGKALLPPGYGIAADKDYSFQIDVPKHDARALESLAQQLYVVGSVKYKDIFGVERMTGYCWVYQPGNKDLPFALVPDSDLNLRT